MFGVFAIDEILRYRGTRLPGSRTLCHPVKHINAESAVFTLSCFSAFCEEEELSSFYNHVPSFYNHAAYCPDCFSLLCMRHNQERERERLQIRALDDFL